MFEVPGQIEVVRGDFYALWRVGDAAWFHITGEIDDARSEEWREAIGGALEEPGYPRFLAGHVSGVVPVNSLPARMRTALFVRRLGKSMEFGVLYSGDNPQMSFALRAVLRAAGIGNLRFAANEDVFFASLTDMAAGTAPDLEKLEVKLSL